jgi:hypothetical protein
MNAILFQLVAVCISWIVIAIGVYEHCQHEFEQEQAEAKAALITANQHAKEVSDERESTVAKISSDLANQTAKANKASKDLHDHIASGALRLSVPVTSCGAVSNDSSTTGGNHEASAQLDPEFAQSLVGLTERGDKAIIELNSCIDSYNSLLSDK